MDNTLQRGLEEILDRHCGPGGDELGAQCAIWKDGEIQAEAYAGHRNGAGTLPVVPETIVSETMELALIQADKLKARIRTLIDPGLPPMTGDAVMLEQLLLNLLKNAMEAVQGCEDRTVELRVHLHDSGHFIQFDVADRGPGISDEAKPLLFDAFYSTKNEGMGMGLNICRSIVEIHQGRITITDTPGGGATFSFTVPLAKL